jgi:hypothetical protein
MNPALIIDLEQAFGVLPGSDCVIIGAASWVLNTQAIFKKSRLFIHVLYPIANSKAETTRHALKTFLCGWMRVYQFSRRLGYLCKAEEVQGGQAAFDLLEE